MNSSQEIMKTQFFSQNYVSTFPVQLVSFQYFQILLNITDFNLYDLGSVKNE